MQSQIQILNERTFAKWNKQIRPKKDQFVLQDCGNEAHCFAAVKCSQSKALICRGRPFYKTASAPPKNYCCRSGIITTITRLKTFHSSLFLLPYIHIRATPATSASMIEIDSDRLRFGNANTYSLAVCFMPLIMLWCSVMGILLACQKQYETATKVINVNGIKWPLSS